MPQGFLAVFTEPGELVPLEEYQDWYNNEHIPLRVDHIEAFLAAARYKATDGITPKWLAVYDVADVEDFNKPNYASLRTNRSAREGELVKNMEMLDRRTYQLVGDRNQEMTSSYHPKNPTQRLVTREFDSNSDADALKWLDAVSSKLGEGHTRTRIYDCINNAKSGTKSSADDQIIPKYLAIHEFKDSIPDDIVSVQTATAEEFGIKLPRKEARRWSLYRAYATIAQKEGIAL